MSSAQSSSGQIKALQTAVIIISTGQVVISTLAYDCKTNTT